MNKVLTEAGKKLEKNKYIYTEGVLSEDVCKKLSDHLFELHSRNELVQDDQCPSSYSVYGDEKFEEVLGNLASRLSDTIGIKVLPTYCYARLYQKGEILHKHKDRPSCEISLTVTLDHDSSSIIWPIVMGDSSNIIIEKGDAVVYKGCEIEHYRESYKGNWQTQAFFHFVDAEGPFKDHAFDGRDSLAAKKLDIIEQKNRPHVYFSTMISQCDSYHPTLEVSDLRFTKEECLKIIDISSKTYSDKARVGSSVQDAYVPEVREVNRYTIPPTPEYFWIFEKITQAVSRLNSEKFKFGLTGIVHGLELLHYSSSNKSHYNWHLDTGIGDSTNRKLSVSVQLSEEASYKGGELLVNDGNIRVGSFEQGSINVFPSYLSHTVTEVTEGDRWAIVIWVHGSDRFK